MKERKFNFNARLVFAAAIILILLAFILFAIFTPRRAEIDDGTLRFKHLTMGIDVPLDEIASVRLLDTLPTLSKVSGIGVYFLSEGRYNVEGYGQCRISLNQSEPPFIAVTTTGGAAYIFSLSAPEETEAFYGELAKATE